MRKFGCKYNELAISPASYRLYLEDECTDLEELDTTGITWLLKPETGSQGQGHHLSYRCERYYGQTTEVLSGKSVYLSL